MSAAGKAALAGIKSRRKNVKKGLSFTIMIVGGSGLGKSTFVNTLTERSAIPPRQDYENAEKAAVEKTIRITPTTVGILLLCLFISIHPSSSFNLNPHIFIIYLL